MSEERRSPLVAQVALIVAFVALAIAGIFTVLVPELSDAGDEETEQREPAETPASEPE